MVSLFSFAHSSFATLSVTMKPLPERSGSLKEKRYVSLSDYEQRLVILSLNRLRNRVIADGIDPIDVDRMLLKMARLNAKRFGRA